MLDHLLARRGCSALDQARRLVERQSVPFDCVRSVGELDVTRALEINGQDVGIAEAQFSEINF